MICLLCQRQFKGLEELRKHNRLSALHKAYLNIFFNPIDQSLTLLDFSIIALRFVNLKTRPFFRSELDNYKQTNLEKPEVLAACSTRKTAARKKHSLSPSSTPSTSTSTEQPKYVDRAAARRSAYNQSDHPEPPSKRKKFEAPEAPTPVAEAPNKDGLEETNTGMKMLEKMVNPAHSSAFLVQELTQGFDSRAGVKELDWERAEQVESIPSLLVNSLKALDWEVRKVSTASQRTLALSSSLRDARVLRCCCGK